MREILKSIASEQSQWVELRFHDRHQLVVDVRKGIVEAANSARKAGVGVRVLVNGTWGFSSTARLGRDGIQEAVRDAILSAESSSAGRSKKIERLADCELAVGDFKSGDAEELTRRPVEEKVELVVETEKQIRGSSELIRSAACRYNEVVDEKWIVSSEGADVHLEDTKVEFSTTAVAARDSEMTTARESVGVTGGWGELFAKWTPESMAQRVSKMSVDLLSAPYAPGGEATVVLDPELVGLLAHEAIGHTVEADFVLSGSAAEGQIGKTVASDLVTLVDSGAAVLGANSAGGIVLVDDEGVPTERTVLIEDGVLKSYLHDRESAAHFGVAPTGNARAWEYSDEQLIRMRNTYIEPGESTLDELLSGIKEGFLLKGAQSGQADANAEFMFGVQEAYEIKDGKVGRLLRGATISGQAFEVLKSIDALSSDFEWAIGSGYCGKGQPAKVDGGGPYVRCRVIVGGR